MQRDFLFEIQGKLVKAFSSKEFLEKTNLEENDIIPFIRNNAFIEELSILYENTEFTCLEILNFCKLLLINIFINEPSEGWLPYAYKYTLNKSFPHQHPHIEHEYETPVIVFLTFLRIIMNETEKINKDSEGNPSLYLEFLTDSEINNLYTPIEYKNFIKSFYDLHVPEMMYLYQELTKLNVYDHSCAVNHFALNIGRQLLKAGIPVDLGNVSGAAVAHNLGQIACKDSLYEKSNIHFNTKIWFENSNAPLIGHIAMYNSIWDLESEILPLESLILIYSNFRINNKNPIQMLPLEVSYNNLLSRLRNSDEALINRFKKAHNRLADFESYLKHLGIQVDMPSKDISNNPLNNYFTLMHGNEIIENLKYQALEHNIHLMFRLRNIDTLNSMIEAAKNSPYSNTLKNILNIFEEYSTFFTQQQKTTILLFLYDLLVHPEEDIRNRSAKLMGIIIGSFDGEYIGKIPENPLAADPSAKSHELFEKYLNNIISPDYKITGLHKDRLGDCLKTMVDSLFNKLDKANITDYRDIIIKYFKEISGYDLITQHHLLQAIKFVPWDNCTEENTDILTSILIHSLQSEYMDIRLISLDAIDCLLNVLSDYFKDKISAIIKDFYQKNAPLSERYLIYKIMCKLKLYENNSETFNKFFLDDISNLSEIYLTNLKSSTSWISKKIHIDFMLNESLCTANNDVFYTAMHFCNLIRISSNESVRINAGRALLDIMPQLSAVQKNDIAIELLRSLEIEGFELASHIPEYLGQVLLYLNPNEFDEQIHEFNIKIKRGNTQAVFLLMNTLGIAITHYTEYINSFNEDRDTSFSRLEQMLGMLLLGYAHYNDEIRQEAFAVLSNIFDTYILSLKEKQAIFDIIGKKILVLLAKCEVSNPLFMNNATSLNRIYRFISEYIHKYGNLELSHPNKIAFFPGTFDPFSLSNKEAAVQIRNMGYEVYLAIDEFSWFKSTQPHLQRQKIVSMSIADERNIYIFPEDIPINIDNPMDMEKLRNIFNNKDITVVIGSNVLVQASCYQSKATGHSIHHFPHIILKRPYLDDEESKNAYDNTLAKLTGPVEELELSEEFRNIRSSLIRKSIDENRDISNLVDPLVQKYIYEQGMYLREPQFKALIKSHAIVVKHYRAANKQLLEALTEALFDNRKEYYQTLHSLVKNKNAEILVLYNTDDEYKILGFSIFHGINSGSFYTEFKNHYVSEHIRQHSIGRMIVIDGIFTEKNAPDSSEQIILSETLALTLSQDYTYAVYKSVFVHENNNKIYDILELQGFEEILRDGTNAIYDVDMSKPCVLNLDVLSFIKEPFRSNDKVIQAVKDARMKLQNALVSLFPGNLVLSFEREALYHSLIEKVCKANNVPEKPLYPRHLGPNMCVPFGQILKEDIVPNTLTKALHTEKIYYPDASDFFIGPYPQYLSLENQIKVLRSFNRPIILLDDILHKGYRIKALSPILNKEELRVEKIIVGILSSKGKELMDTQGHQIDAAYYIPNLKNWFTEAMLYPFIGGDSIIQASAPVKNLLPSVNLIFPYASPFFIKGASLDSLMTLSKVCIENAMSILRVLENQYQLFHGRSLTLNYLGEVLVSPRYPDKGQDVHHNYNDKASAFLSSDLDHLSRMRHIVSPDKNEL